MERNRVDKMTLATIDDWLLDPAQRHVEPRAAGMVGHCRMFSQAKSINREERTIDFTCSTNDIDRYGEVVEPSAFRASLRTFMKNPAFPAGHFYEFTNGQSPTVGHWREMKIAGDALIGTAWFKPRGLGEEIWLDYLEGNLNSVSVAFLTRAWEMRELDIDGSKRRVRVFTDVELLEVSAVLIPANAQARIRAAGLMPDNALAPLLKRVADQLDKLESRSAVDPDDYLRTLDDDDADELHDRGVGDDGYFGDITGLAAPEPAPASMGNSELKAALRDALGARDAA